MRKHIKARMDRALELGRLDAAKRCTACRRALPRMGSLLMLTPAGEQLRYCDENCRQDHIDALETVAAQHVKGMR